MLSGIVLELKTELQVVDRTKKDARTEGLKGQPLLLESEQIRGGAQVPLLLRVPSDSKIYPIGI